MAIQERKITYRTFTCDKCGYEEKDDTTGPQVNFIKQEDWLSLALTQLGGRVYQANPLGEPSEVHASALLCPGCRGMLETFLEIDVKKTGVNSYGDATQAMPNTGAANPFMSAKVAKDVGLFRTLVNPSYVAKPK